MYPHTDTELRLNETGGALVAQRINEVMQSMTDVRAPNALTERVFVRIAAEFELSGGNGQTVAFAQPV